MTVAAFAGPLSGITVLVTRPRESALARVLRRAGARVVWQPAICIEPDIATPELDAALRRLSDFEWIVLTSVPGASAFWRRVAALRVDRHAIAAARFAAVGPATARAIERGGARVDVIAKPFSAEGLVLRLTDRLAAGSTVLHPCAREARPILGDGLRRLGARITEAMAYQTGPSPAVTGLPMILDAGVDCVVFCSPSAVRAVLPHHTVIARSAIACIGPTTAAAAQAAGLRVQIVAPQATATELAEAVIEYFRPNAAALPAGASVAESAR